MGQIWVKQVRQRKDGRWEARCSDGRSFYGRTQAEALGKVRTQPDSLTLGEFIPDWLGMIDVRPTTWRGYESIARCHFKPLEKTPLTAMTPLQVQRWVLEQGGSPRSVQYRHAVLRRCLADAMRLGLIQHNPARGVSIPRQVRYQGKPLDTAQVAAVLRATEGTRWHALLVLAISCGLRRGELLGLRWADVQGRTLRVSNTVVRVRDGLLESPPKSDRSTRTLALPDVAVNALEAHRAFSAGRLVFQTKNGKPFEPSTVNKVWSALRTTLGIDARFHDLRHSCATLLLNAGLEPSVIQATLGHSTIALTLNTYAHVLPPMQAQAAATMDLLLGDTEIK